MTDMDAEPRLIGELLQLHFPGARAIAIAPARVRREIVDAHLLRPAGRLPFSPAIPEIPDQFLLLGVDRDDRLLMLQETIRRGIEVLKLRVAIEVRRAFMALPRRLQAIAQIVEEPAHCRRADAPSLLRQRGRQFRATLAGPPQGRHRVAAGQRIDQRLQGVPEARLRVLEAGTPGAHAALPVGGRAAAYFPTRVASSSRLRYTRTVNQRMARSW